MRSRRFALLALAAAATALGGCVHAQAGVAVRIGSPVAIAHGHSHTAHCGHFKHRGRWYFVADHHHGPQCGHRLQGKHWVLVR